MFGGYFDVENKKKNVFILEKRLDDMYKQNKWDKDESIKLSKEISNDKKIISMIESLNDTLKSYEEIIELNDEELIKEVVNN